jgi:hypothetical protein
VFREQARLRDQIVFMEVTENHHVKMNAKRYLTAARTAREIVERELGDLQMREFAIRELPALQVTAENIYFDSYGCFADLDGSGHAALAQRVADALIERLSAAPAARG